MTTCPCCSNPMLRHVKLQQTYWFCRHCWQEMPNLMLEENRFFLGLSVTLVSQLKEPLHQISDLKIYPELVK